MCEFCENIFDEKLWQKAVWHQRKKYSDEEVEKAEKELDRLKEFTNRTYDKYDGDYIYHYDGKLYILAETGDGFQEGTVNDIKFCPYCGRKLEIEDASTN